MSTLDTNYYGEKKVRNIKKIRARQKQASTRSRSEIYSMKESGNILGWISDAKICSFWTQCTKAVHLSAPDVKTYEQMPPFCRERNIQVGYRPNPSSLRYCLTSVLHPTNETLNFWTHFLPFLYLATRHYNFSQEPLFKESPGNVFVYSFWAYSFGTLTMLAVSSLAHLLNCISPRIRHVCYCSDYGAISIYSLGVAASTFYLTSPPLCREFIADSSDWYITLAMISAVSTHVFCCCSRFPRVKSRYTIRSTAFANLCLVIHYPSILRLFSILIERTSLCPISAEKSEAITFLCSSLKAISRQKGTTNAYCDLGDQSFPFYYSLHLLLLAISGIFNVTRFPEKHFPGRFDIIGSSHQFFHITTALAFIFQTVFVEDAVLGAILRAE